MMQPRGDGATLRTQRRGVTSIEYALMGSFIAVVIFSAVSLMANTLAATFLAVVNLFPK